MILVTKSLFNIYIKLKNNNIMSILKRNKNETNNKLLLDFKQVKIDVPQRWHYI